MITFAEKAPVYLHKQPVDFRKQINGLSLIVQNDMELNLFEESFFVFINRSRNKIKILYWQRNGFCLWHKRLEKDKFTWPKSLNDAVIAINTQELQWLLEGFDIWNKPPHQTLDYRRVG